MARRIKRLAMSETKDAPPVREAARDETAAQAGIHQYLAVKPRGRLLFLHVPKTAGMSMRAYLTNQYHPADVFAPTNWTEAFRTGRDLADFKLYSGHYRANFARRVPPDTRTLVVLRDPVQRLLSSLQHLRRDPDFHPDHVLAKGKTLAEMINTPEIMANQTNAQVGWMSAVVTPGKVEAYLADHPDGDAVDVERQVDPAVQLARAKRNLAKVDFIGFTEDLRPLLAQLADEMDFHPVVSFPRLNENLAATTWDDRLGAAEIVKIRDCVALDQQFYDYAGHLVEQRRVTSAIRRQRDSGRLSVPEGMFELAFDQPVPGSGWYEPERDTGAYYRWTGPERQFTLDLPLASSRYAVCIAFNRMAATVDADFTVTANGVPLAVNLQRGGGLDRQAKFEIPQAVVDDGQGVVRLVMDAGAVARPSDHGDIADSRLLGVVVFRVEFAPLPPRGVEDLRRDYLRALLDTPAWWLVEAEGQEAPVQCGTLRQAVRAAVALRESGVEPDRVYADEVGVELMGVDEQILQSEL